MSAQGRGSAHSASPASDPAGTETAIEIAAPQDVVYGYLVDPTTYPDWLVGAKRIRRVDDAWPEPGARFHHRVGFGPLAIDDDTTVVSADPSTELVLRASIGPLGAALITFRLEGSSPTRVHFEEAPVAGPIRVVGRSIGRVALRASVWGRNAASLARLRDLVERPADDGSD